MTMIKDESGFSLVELALSILIIGLLIAGILKGYEMVGNAQVVATINQLNEIETASTIFQTKYRQLPGDITDPEARIPNCTTAPCNVGGDEDGYLDLTSDEMEEVVWGTLGHESRNYWMHLAAAGLLRATQDHYVGTPNRFGVDFPKTPIGGGWLIQSFRDGQRRRTYMTPIKAVTTFTDENSRLFSPARAHQLDMKVDDGYADRGKVRGYFPSTSGLCTQAGGSEVNRNTYLFEYNDGDDCNLAILLTRAYAR